MNELKLYPCMKSCHCGWSRPVVIVTNPDGRCVAHHADDYCAHMGLCVIGVSI